MYANLGMPKRLSVAWGNAYLVITPAVAFFPASTVRLLPNILVQDLGRLAQTLKRWDLHDGRWLRRESECLPCMSGEQDR